MSDEKRIASLERKVRLLLIGWLASGGLMVFVAADGAARSTDTIKAKTIVVEDSTGRERINIGTHGKTAYIAIFNRGRDEKSCIQFGNNNGKPAMEVTYNNSTGGFARPREYWHKGNIYDPPPPRPEDPAEIPSHVRKPWEGRQWYDPR